MSFMPMLNVEWLVVHCSATPANQNMTFAELRHTHMLRGESTIGYHYVIERDGLVVEGRDRDTPGAHASGYNRHSIGICLIGGRKGKTNKTEDNFTAQQKASLRLLLDGLVNVYERVEVVGHCDLPGVLHGCPGFSVQDFYYGNPTT